MSATQPPSFLSPEGFPPRVWGPLIWQASHIILANYPLEPTDRDVDAYMMYFRSLCSVLPCRVCRQHFCALVNDHPRLKLRRGLFAQARGERPGAARDRVFSWFVRVHANVNRRLGKPYPGDVRGWKRAYAGLRG